MQWVPRTLERASRIWVFRYQSYQSRQTLLKSPCRPFSARSIQCSTIYALSTAPGRAAIAIIRCSGEDCASIHRALCPDVPLPKPRYASLRTLFRPHGSSGTRQILDASSLVLFFPGPETVTGEDVLEFHVHGGPAVVKAVLAAISSVSLSEKPGQAEQPTVRYAEPGEFTKRAFYNNRLTIPQIEALGDVLTAETEQQRQLAVRGAGSVLTARYEGWRRQLLYSRGELEALIDFAEDQQFEESPEQLLASVSSQIDRLQKTVKSAIDNAARGELLRNGITIALLGEPNAGKSSLLNRIVGREAAIVSQEAGTTRDVVDVNVDIGGFFCRLGDLAGLRDVEHESSGIREIEEEGIRRARRRVQEANVVMVVLPIQHDRHGLKVRISPEVRQTLEQCDWSQQRCVLAVNKMDLASSKAEVDESAARELLAMISLDSPSDHRPPDPTYVSCLEDSASLDFSEGNGIPALLNDLTATFQSMTRAIESPQPHAVASWEEALGATERQRLLLLDCLDHLEHFRAAIRNPDEVDVVLAAEDLRSAANCLAKITGHGEAGDVEEVLGVVFEKFCVGK